MRQNKKEIITEILRFLIVGGLATIADYAVFYSFTGFILNDINITVNITISTALGFLTGLFVNWFLQKKVFKYLDDNIVKSKKTFIKFFILSLFGLLLTELILNLASPLYDTLMLKFIIEFDFWKLFFKLLMTGIVLVINYLGRKFYVFKA